MARAKKQKSTAKKNLPLVGFAQSLRWWLRRIIFRGVAIVFLVMVLLVVLWGLVNPPTNLYMFSESRRLDGVQQEWVPLEDIAPVMARAAVAAEDANFCEHWGFDVRAIRAAIAQGGNRGASTISQQVVKNVFLWHGRSFLRKGLEAMMTPLMEGLWTKRRVIEVYLNIAEFDEGVFGVGAAAPHYFGVSAKDLSPTQAARLAAVLPSPKKRSASSPTASLRKRASQIRSGAATIREDGRSACFES